VRPGHVLVDQLLGWFGFHERLAGQFDTEPRAMARFALGADRPAHQRHQIAGDRQTQPGAAELALVINQAWVKRSNRRSIMSRSMPMPVSLTVMAKRWA
jgi:hypothetical protein